MAPVISSTSNFIKGGSRWTPWCTAGSRWLGITTTVPLPYPHEPSECSATRSLLRSPYFDLPVLHNNTAATPLHATVLCIIRHQRPTPHMTAASVSCSYSSSPKIKTQHDHSLKKKKNCLCWAYMWFVPADSILTWVNVFVHLCHYCADVAVIFLHVGLLLGHLHSLEFRHKRNTKYSDHLFMLYVTRWIQVKAIIPHTFSLLTPDLEKAAQR